MQCSVYDLARTEPDVVLRYGLGYLDKLALAGDGCARTTRTNLRIMVFFPESPLSLLYQFAHKTSTFGF